MNLGTRLSGQRSGAEAVFQLISFVVGVSFSAFLIGNKMIPKQNNSMLNELFAVP